MTKSYFDVLGLCCTSEVPLVERILNSMNGVEKVLVNVTTQTVIVFHDDLLSTKAQIVNALNQAGLEANVRVYGEEKKGIRWPKWYTMGCGLLLIVSLFQYIYHPLKWLSLAAAIFGLPPIVARSYGSARNMTIDINILMLIAVVGTAAMQDFIEAGSIVFLFTIGSYISVRTTALADDCAVSKMSKLVEEAQNTRSKTQLIIDNVSKYYTPVVILLAILLAVIPAALKFHNLKKWGHLALVVLVSACPCSLIISTPTAIFCALTKGATSGLLIKGGDYLEILAKIKVVAFDKTGTLTRGTFSVTGFQSVSQDVSLDNLIYWVASIESKSSHPMAAALVEYGSSNSIHPQPENVTEYQNFPGEGISGEIDGKKIYIGNKKMATRVGCEIVSDLERDGETIGYVFLENIQIGTFSVADTCRTGVAEAIQQLKVLGLETAMLTGDSHSAAMRVQDQLGQQALDYIYADLLPEEKVNFIKELKQQGPTAMIGDGVNDAPALATADIGIAMGIGGSALAAETSHLTLMSNDIGKIPLAIRLARRTRITIIVNVSFSIVSKVAVLASAVAGHPVLWAAVLADVGTCLIVIFISMLLLWGTPGTHTKDSREDHTHGHCHGKEGSCGSKAHQENPTER
ncbi:hypothetical protein MKW92_027056 [Papaver armeniacum]|nr:hypothetical protein MKW92_027056 [Papaver armeniacum]